MTVTYSKRWSVRNRCQAIARLDFLEIGPKFLRAVARRSGNEQFQRRFLICPKNSAPRAPADFLKAISKATSLTVWAGAEDDWMPEVVVKGRKDEPWTRSSSPLRTMTVLDR